MNWDLVWPWVGAGVVGLAMGLLGSGGAILTVPILVYLLRHDEKSAIAESMVIVGVIALTGATRAAIRRNLDVRSAVALALPGMAGAYLGAHAAGYVPGAVQLVLLAALMLVAAAFMCIGQGAGRNGAGATATGGAWVTSFQGFGLGFATGLVGVGGGFLIVPVLVLLRGLEMPRAVGTSLAVIAMNSAVGFLKSWWMLRGEDHGGGIDWTVVGTFAGLGAIGGLVGNMMSDRVPQRALKRGFSLFLVVMAGYILMRQAPRMWPGAAGPPKEGGSTVQLEPAGAGESQTR